jgi:hypothetical protein
VTAADYVVIHVEHEGCDECAEVAVCVSEFAARTSAPGATMRLGLHGAQVLPRLT